MKKYRITQVRYADKDGKERMENIDLTVSNMKSIENFRKDYSRRYNATNIRFTYEEREED